MIQRIQSLYLLLASFSLLSMLLLPLGAIHSQQGSTIIYKTIGFFNPDNDCVFSLTYMNFIIIITAVWIFAIVFYFKKRKIQMRLSMIAIFYNLCILTFALYFWFKMVSSIHSQTANVSSMIYPSMFFPLVSIIFLILSYRKIKKDEALIQSLDRIR